VVEGRLRQNLIQEEHAPLVRRQPV
jgi:hypothetical protein